MTSISILMFHVFIAKHSKTMQALSKWLRHPRFDRALVTSIKSTITSVIGYADVLLLYIPYRPPNSWPISLRNHWLHYSLFTSERNYLVGSQPSQACASLITERGSVGLLLVYSCTTYTFLFTYQTVPVQSSYFTFQQ